MLGKEEEECASRETGEHTCGRREHSAFEEGLYGWHTAWGTQPGDGSEWPQHERDRLQGHSTQDGIDHVEALHPGPKSNGKPRRVLRGSDIIVGVMKRSSLLQHGRCFGEGQE